MYRRPQLRVGLRLSSPIKQIRAFRIGSTERSKKNRVFESVRNEDEFNSLLLLSASGRQSLVTLWTASWCPSCKVVAPLIRKPVQDGAGEEEGGLSYVEVEADSKDTADLLMRHGITSIPTLLAFRNQQATLDTRVTSVNNLKDPQFISQWLAARANERG